MSQILVAFAGGAIIITEQLAAIVATTHQYIAVILVTEGIFSNVGSAIRGSISTAPWTGLFPMNLVRYMSAEAQEDFTAIYGSILAQLPYSEGTPVRYTIERAYGESQKWMTVASTLIPIVALGAVLA